MQAPLIPTSWGELIDKITILEIKAVRITAPAARANVEKELALLAAIAAPVLAGDMAELKSALRVVNETLWDTEDAIRGKEKANDFGADFIALARSVYKQNDSRAELKRGINNALGSDLKEEKSYH